jgi:hypothetical protein
MEETVQQISSRSDLMRRIPVGKAFSLATSVSE